MRVSEPDPIEHRSETARRNGSLSRGPVTAEGKACSAMNATRHGVCATTMVPGTGEDVELAALRTALLMRWQPADAAEAHLVEELVFAAWRQVRLRAVEDAVLARAGRGEGPSPGLPSLATLMRYRGRIDRDARVAAEELAALRRGRRELADPMRLRWLAERIERAQAIAGASRPEAGTMASGDAARTNEPPVATVEPEARDFTYELAPRASEPRHLVPPLTLARAEAPAAMPNRQA